MINITNAEKKEIRSHYGYMKLRFTKNGTVEAQQRKNGAWGLLYDSEALINHVMSIRERKEREKL